MAATGAPAAGAQSVPMGDGRPIPLVGFGTYLLGQEEAAAAVLEALRAGYRHVDTAEGYRNEAGVGEALRASGLAREEVFLTSKVFPGNPSWNMPAKGYDACIEQCEASLKLLGTDYLDLYLIHAPFCKEERLDQWRALVELQRQGKCRSIGVSNYSQAHLEEIRAAGLPPPAVDQIELHPFCAQSELRRHLGERGILPVAYSSLAPLGTWRPGQPSAKAERGAAMDGELPFGAMAARYGCTEAQLLLRWAVQRGVPVLPKSARPERARENLALAGPELSAEDLAALDALDRGAAVAWPPLDPAAVP